MRYRRLAGRPLRGSTLSRRQLGSGRAGVIGGSVNAAPVITTAATANNAENVALAIALTANEAVAWTLTGGADQARFEISGTTLRWASNGTKDFETPDDADVNNTYVVQVTATDTTVKATNKTITVTVTDVAEGAVALQLLYATPNTSEAWVFW